MLVKIISYSGRPSSYERKMGKNSKKNKRDALALQRIRLERDGGPTLVNRPTQQLEIEADVARFDADGALIIEVQEDVDVGHIDTPTSLLAPPMGYRTKSTDECRYFDYLLKKELRKPGTRLADLPRDEIHHVTSHAKLDDVVGKFIQLSESAGDIFEVGLDTEGQGDTLQLSARVGGREINAVFQLRSEMETPHGKPPRGRIPRHLFKEGPPDRLLEIFRLKNVMFIGKDISSDTIEVATMLGMPREEAELLLVSDLAKTYAFISNMAKHPKELWSWIDTLANPGALGFISLKDVVQFADTSIVLDKSPNHRNQNAEFGERKGKNGKERPIRDREIKYAALDAQIALVTHQRLTRQLGIRSRHLSEVAGCASYQSWTMARVVKVFCDKTNADAGLNVIGRIDDQLEPREKQEVEDLRECRLEMQRRCAAFEREIIERRTEKKVLMRRLKSERDGCAGVSLEVVPIAENRLVVDIPSQVIHTAEETIMSNTPEDVRAPESDLVAESPERVVTYEEVQQSGKNVIDEIDTHDSYDTDRADSDVDTDKNLDNDETENGETDNEEHDTDDSPLISGERDRRLGVKKVVSLAGRVGFVRPDGRIGTIKRGKNARRGRKHPKYEPIRVAENDDEFGITRTNEAFIFNREEFLTYTSFLPTFPDPSDPQPVPAPSVSAPIPPPTLPPCSQTTQIRSLLSIQLKRTHTIPSLLDARFSRPPFPAPSQPLFRPRAPVAYPHLPPPPPTPPPSPFVPAPLRQATASVSPDVSGVRPTAPPRAAEFPAAPGVSRRQSIAEFDRKKLDITFGVLKHVDPEDYVKALDHLHSPSETVLMGRFIDILLRFKVTSNSRPRMYKIARAMLAVLTTCRHAFVLTIFEKQIFGQARLHVAVQLQYVWLSPKILLDHVLTKHCDNDQLAFAAQTMCAAEVAEVMKFAAIHARDPTSVLEKIKNEDCFRTGYTVERLSERWTERRLRDFISFICDKANIPIPPEANKLFVRVSTSVELDSYFRGETEIEDFYRMSLEWASNDEALLHACLEVVAERSRPLAQFYMDLRGIAVEIPPSASDFVPACVAPANAALHRLIVADAAIITTNPVVNDFRFHLENSRHFSIIYHGSASVRKLPLDFLTFRMRKKVFFYSPALSRSYREAVARILKERTDEKKVFVYKEKRAVSVLQTEFQWTPKVVVDAKQVAADNQLHPTMSGIAEALVGGPYCRRGFWFSDMSIPSQVALRHRNMNASLIYEFCVQFLHLRGTEMRAHLQERARDGDDDVSRSRSTRPKERPDRELQDARSRSRFR